MAERVAGKVALVTGGASGLGAETARVLAREGAAVMLTDRDPAGEAVALAIEAAGGKAAFMAHDVTQEAEWEQVVATTLARFGSLHILVNNAGIGGGEFDLMTAELATWRAMMAVNLDGVFLGLRHAGPAIAAAGGGSVINLSSILGLVGMAGAAHYCAAKGGVKLLTKAAALEWAPLNIRINNIAPGFIATEGLGVYNDEVRRDMPNTNLMRRLGSPTEIADAVCYLGSPAGGFITGELLTIDGGNHIWGDQWTIPRPDFFVPGG